MDLLDRLACEDKELLKRSWAVLEKNINDTAYCIFDMIFCQSPDTKQVGITSLQHRTSKIFENLRTRQDLWIPPLFFHNYVSRE